MLHRLPVVISILFVSLQAGAANVPFSPALQEMEVTAGDATLHVRVGGQGPAVVMLHGFGDTGDMWAPLAAELVARSHRRHSRPARHGPLVAAGGRLRQKEPGGRYRRNSRQAQHCAGRSRDARHRQHGRLCVRRPISRSRHPLGGDGCAASRHRQLGKDHTKPAALAFQFPRAGRRTFGERS